MKQKRFIFFKLFYLFIASVYFGSSFSVTQQVEVLAIINKIDISAKPITGSVTFGFIPPSNANVCLNTRTLSVPIIDIPQRNVGIASCLVQLESTQNYHITATYNGDTEYESSRATTNFPQNLEKQAKEENVFHITSQSFNIQEGDVEPHLKTINVNEKATFIATPQAGFVVKEWKLNEESQPDCEFQDQCTIPYEKIPYDSILQVYFEAIKPSVAVGNEQSCALNKTGGVFCWGKNKLGELNPELSIGVTTIAAGQNHACAIKNGLVYCWGEGFDSQKPIPELKNVSAVATGDYDTCAISQKKLYCLKNSKQGLLVDLPVTAISVGENYACAIANSDVYCWGQNTDSQVSGNGRAYEENMSITKVSEIPFAVSEIATGWYHTCALSDNKVYCWGRNQNGEVVGDGVDIASPKPVTLVSDTSKFLNSNVHQVAVGAYHTCIVKGERGVTYCFGKNSEYQTNVQKKKQEITMASRVMNLPRGIVHIASYLNQTCAITKNAAVYCWGDDSTAKKVAFSKPIKNKMETRLKK